mmetsp:Transcript_44211/g.94839  ORF Transcript_44211/g.94839 Transcript_44211/m.94839 type:complete len:420 (+) Transcript_44211:400-1659(+)
MRLDILRAGIDQVRPSSRLNGLCDACALAQEQMAVGRAHQGSDLRLVGHDVAVPDLQHHTLAQSCSRQQRLRLARLLGPGPLLRQRLGGRLPGHDGREGSGASEDLLQHVLTVAAFQKRQLHPIEGYHGGNQMELLKPGLNVRLNLFGQGLFASDRYRLLALQRHQDVDAEVCFPEVSELLLVIRMVQQGLQVGQPHRQPDQQLHLLAGLVELVHHTLRGGNALFVSIQVQHTQRCVPNGQGDARVLAQLFDVDVDGAGALGPVRDLPDSLLVMMAEAFEFLLQLGQDQEDATVLVLLLPPGQRDGSRGFVDCKTDSVSSIQPGAQASLDRLQGGLEPWPPSSSLAADGAAATPCFWGDKRKGLDLEFGEVTLNLGFRLVQHFGISSGEQKTFHHVQSDVQVVGHEFPLSPGEGLGEQF